MNKRRVTVICAASIAAAFVLSYFGCYLGAGVSADRGNFTRAEDLLFLPGLTALHDENMLQYVEAGLSFQRGDYAGAEQRFRALSGYRASSDMVNESMYRYAGVMADQGNFKRAIEYFTVLSSVNYKDSGSKILETKCLKAKALAAEGDYIFALQDLKALKAEGNLYATEMFEEITSEAYVVAQEAYHKGNYAKARGLFLALIPYEDSAKYSALTNAHMGFNPSEAEYKTIINAMDFEDVKEALVSNSPIADRFLEGTWKTSDGKYYLTLDGFSCRSNNVYTPKYELYMISDGVLSFLRSSTDVFKFTVLTENSISVYCYKDGSTYTLYRQ